MTCKIGALLLAVALCGCGKSNKSTSAASPSSPPALVVAQGPPPAPVAAVPIDHAFDGDGFAAHDLAHGDGAMKLLVNRQWNGASVRAGHFGPGWSDGNALHLTMVDRDQLIIWRGEVGWRKAHRSGDKSFEGEGGEKIQQSDKGWSAQMSGGVTLTFDPQGRLTSAKPAEGPACNYTYEKNGRLASVGTSAENALKFAYDSSGKRVTRIDGPEDLRLDYEYDDKGRLSAATNARKIRVQYRYADDGALAAAEDQFGNRFDFGQPIQVTAAVRQRAMNTAGPARSAETKETAVVKQDGFGRVVSRSDDDGRSTRFEYNNLDLPTLIAVSGEAVEHRQFNEHGMLVRRERGSTQREDFAYDSGGRLAAKRSAQGVEQQYEYDADDRITRVKQTGGAEIAYDYAPDGKLIDESSSSGEKRHWNYNAAGQLIEFVDENGLKTTYGYDNQGRLSFSEDRVHGRKSISYTAENEITTETPDLGRSVVKSTAWGRPLLKTQPGDRTTIFRYGNAGTLLGIIPPSGVWWEYESDDANGLRMIKSPAGLTTSIGRDQAGRVGKVSRGEIVRREYRYDNAGRLQQEFSPAGAVASFKYGDDGRVTEVLLPEGKVTYRFDQGGLHLKGAAYELEESYHSDGSLARRLYQPAKMELRLPRDGQGRAAGIELNDLKVAYVYNARGQIEQIKLPSGAIQIARDDAGRTTGLTLEKGATVEIKYDRADRITRLEAKQTSGKSLFTERYAYDAAGNVAEVATDSAPPQKFEYDRDDRLTKMSDGKTTHGWQYDVDGNIAGMQSGPQVLRRGLDSQGRPTEQGASSFSWSANGNLETTETTKGKKENSFDAADRLVRRTVGDDSWTLGYLPDGDRLWKEKAGKRRWYAYLPDRLAGIKDEAGVDWLLICLPGSDWPIALAGSNGKTFLILADRVGSARRFVDETGAIVASADYSPFGMLRASSGTPPLGLFAGMISDNSGLCYARQRYYDPEIGQFVSLDPEIGTMGNPATHNPYAYAGNNPLRYRDPLGTDFASEVAAPDSNLFNCLTELQQAAVKEAWDGAQRASRVLNSPMKSTPAEIAAASRHLEECNAALAKMNEIARARYNYVLLASGPTEELSAVGKANAARNTAEAKAALDALGEMPRVGRVDLGLNAENLGSTLQNVPITPSDPSIPPSRALVPQGPTALGEAGTSARGAGAGMGGSGEWGAGSGGWSGDPGDLYTGRSPIDKMGRPTDIPMKFDPKTGGWRPAIPSGSGASFARRRNGALARAEDPERGRQGPASRRTNSSDNERNRCRAPGRNDGQEFHR